MPMTTASARACEATRGKVPVPIVSPDTNAKSIDSSTDQPSISPITRPSPTMTAKSPTRIGHTTRNPAYKPLTKVRRIVRGFTRGFMA